MFYRFPRFEEGWYNRRMEFLGYAGVVAFAIAWIPQTLETIRAGRCGANSSFLILYAFGSACLTAYSVLRGDRVFTILNGMATVAAVVNVFYWLFPRRAA